MKNIMKISASCILLVAILSFTGCVEDDSSDSKMAEITSSSLEQAFSEVGMPAIKNWTELRMAKMLYELRDNPKLVNYVYSKNNYTGLFTYMGRCIGYGLPASVQYSNPVRQKRVGKNSHWKWMMVPQAEPNGLFMPEGLSATYVMLINEETGDATPMYFEDPVTVVGHKLPARLIQTRKDIEKWFGDKTLIK